MIGGWWTDEGKEFLDDVPEPEMRMLTMQDELKRGNKEQSQIKKSFPQPCPLLTWLSSRVPESSEY